MDEGRNILKIWEPLIYAVQSTIVSQF